MDSIEYSEDGSKITKINGYEPILIYHFGEFIRINAEKYNESQDN